MQLALRSPNPSTAARLGNRFLRACRPAARLSLRAWVEANIIIATGPYHDRPFRCATNPWTGLWFDELDRDHWTIVALVAPTQTGKTLCGFVYPTAYTADMLRESVVLAIPDGKMVADKFSQDIWPPIEASDHLRHLIPRSGPGSKGGTIKDAVKLGNGVHVKIINRGGDDTGKAGYTTRHVHFTEAAGWSHASESSQEASPFEQVLGRMLAYKRDQQRAIIEGTVTVADELPWSLKGEEADGVVSTDSRIVKPCPHCGQWVAPERPQLRGWQQARDAIEAAELAHWVCPKCEQRITAAERRAMNAAGQLVHAGQSIDDQGEIHGEEPPTRTLFFRVTAFDNQLKDAEDIGPEEWNAAQKPEGTEERENAEKKLCQQFWCIPFKSQLAELEPLKPALLRRRLDRELPRGVLPADTVKVAVGIDCGKYRGWWIVLAGRANGVIHVVAYGSFEVCQFDERDVQTSEIESRLQAALDELIDETLEAGFQQSAEALQRLADTAWIDRGWMKGAVCSVCRSRGTLRDNRYRASKGYGKTSRSKKVYKHPPKRTKVRYRIGDHWFAELSLIDRLLLFNFDADYWKLRVHEGLRIKPGCKGSITFYRADNPEEHKRLTQHLCAEQFQRQWVLGKGFVDDWVKSGQNHLLDCAAEGMAALDSVGYRLLDIAGDEASADGGGDQDLVAEAADVDDAEFWAEVAGDD